MISKKFVPLLMALTAGIGYADIVVTLPKDCDQTSINYYYAPIKQYAEAKTRAERGVVSDSVKLENCKAVVSIPSSAEGYMYVFNIDDQNIRVFVAPEDNVKLDVVSFNPFAYSLSGTALADGMDQLQKLEFPIIQKANQLGGSSENNSDEMEALANQYNEVQKNFIASNPTNPAAAYALLNLEGEEFINTYDGLQDALNGSMLYPLVKKQYETEKKGLEMQKKQEALQSGNIMAPDFTLKDLEGNDISLSQFRGKWVILDFWGSWCPWCIKGFPELKEAYRKYAGKLEIIGIDCNESEADWKAGVEKYQLPWVNVYNPSDSSLLGEYGVQGFPTKAIIGPEGKIANITVGHDPSFFKVLSSLID